jgi:hypothetical protein
MAVQEEHAAETDNEGPLVVPLLRLLSTANKAALVQRLCRGGTLRDELERRKQPLDESSAKVVFRYVGVAGQATHPSRHHLATNNKHTHQPHWSTVQQAAAAERRWRRGWAAQAHGGRAEAGARRRCGALRRVAGPRAAGSIRRPGVGACARSRGRAAKPPWGLMRPRPSDPPETAWVCSN